MLWGILLMDNFGARLKLTGKVTALPGALTALFCLTVVAVSQFVAHARIDEYDAWLFAYYGRELLDGAKLYADVWDNKPPGIFWLNALGLSISGGELWGVWILCATAAVTSVLAVFAIAWIAYGKSAAMITAALAAVYLNMPQFHVGCNRPATFFVPTELGCIGLYLIAITGKQRCRTMLLLSGCCAGLGVCLKQSALAATAAIGLHILWRLLKHTDKRRQTVLHACLLVLGGTLTVGTAVLGLAFTSDPTWAWDAVVGFNRAYFKPDVGSSFVPTFVWADDYMRAMGLPVVLALATLVHGLRHRLIGNGDCPTTISSQSGQPSGWLFLLWSWMLAAIYLAALGPHGRAPYLAVALPPLVILSGHAVHLLLLSQTTSPSQRRPAFHVVVAVIWLGYMLYWPLQMQLDMAGRQYAHRFLIPPTEYRLSLEQGIDRHSAAGDRMFKFGYSPDLYWSTNLRPACRFIGTEKAGQLLHYGQPVIDEITRKLRLVRPRIIVLNPEAETRAAKAKGLDVAEAVSWVELNYYQPDPDVPTLWVVKDESPSDARP